MISPSDKGRALQLYRLAWALVKAKGTDCHAAQSYCAKQQVIQLTFRYPGDTPVMSVGKRMKCSKCGSKKITMQPELYPGGIMAMRKKWR